MKKLLTLLMLSCTLICCQKTSTYENSPDENEESLILQSANPRILIKASSLHKSKDSIVRQIELLDSRDSSLLYAYNIKAENSSQKDINISRAITEKKFRGKVSISMAGVELLSHDYKLGTTLKANKQKAAQEISAKQISQSRIGRFKMNPQPDFPCTIDTVHDCVSFKIDDMNWVDYAICVASAPACYGQLWASCTYDVCVNGEEFNNPFKP